MNSSVRNVLVIATEPGATTLAQAFAKHNLQTRTLKPGMLEALSEWETEWFGQQLQEWLNAADLILLEQDPQKVNGLLTLEQLRSHPRCAITPIVMIAKQWSTSELARATHARANSCLEWPTAQHQETWSHDISHFWTVLNEPAH